MKSSDFVDLTGNGPSADDVGTYYKINHSQIYGDAPTSPGAYKWRFPISDAQGKQAIFNRGFLGTDLDNMANYSYGEKEIWYTHSIETRNYIAEFHLQNREDAYGGHEGRHHHEVQAGGAGCRRRTSPILSRWVLQTELVFWSRHWK